jgi:3-hydroxyacyl-CoA dehydrogenase/enoyl-CoA hydratase/3-hydroxybutyryl-CoA epimerase
VTAAGLKVEQRQSAWFEAPGQGGVGRIVIDRPDDSVNALNPELVEALGAAVRAARGCPELRGLIVGSAKPDQWLAGADLKLLPQAKPAELERLSRRFQAVCDELAWLPCTSVAALNGPALGGGCELALACDYRIAADRSNVRVGQPEVTLGLVPAGGGTQRLPRLVGLARALELILAGRQLDTRRARRVGLLDEVVHPSVLDAAARAWAVRPKRPLDRRLTFAGLAELTSPGRRFLYGQARKRVLRRTGGHYPAPLRALECMAIGMEQGMAAGLEAEAHAFAELAATPAARNLIWLFLAGQRQRRVFPSPGAQRPQRSLKRAAGGSIERLGVVGAGFMGSGIAEVAAAAGLPVRVRDVAPEAVARGLASVRRLVDEGVRRHRFRASEAAAIVQRVSGTTDYSGFAHLDAVIEAVFEDLDTKRQVLSEIEAVVSHDALIATNTSALPITEIACVAQHPQRVVGMHFFSPAHRMPLLEVVRGRASSEQAVAQAVQLGIRMGKTPIVVGGAPGFYTSRVLGVMLNEASVLLTEGAGIDEVDAAMTAFGFPVGPFVLSDEVGLQVAQHAGQTLLHAWEARLPRVEVVPRLVAAGRTGKQSGAGFYDWRSRRPDPEVYRLVGNPPRRPFGRQAIQERLVLLFVNEAIRCLEEGILGSASDGDLGAVLGLGFPAFLGGPFHYADSLPDLEDRLTKLAEQHGPRYAPPASLAPFCGKT